MDDAIPFAGVFLVLAVIAWTTWPQQLLLAIVLGFVALAILIARAVELS